VNIGIQAQIVWRDNQVIKCLFSCSNGRFSGQAEIYMSHDGFSEMADALSGFPSRPNDLRDFKLGSFDPKNAGGGIKMHFYCHDSLGHAAVKAKLTGDGCKTSGNFESVALVIPVEAAGIDSFVGQLRRVEVRAGSTIHLTMAG